MITITAKTFDPKTRDWTKIVTYEARDRMEAVRWQNFNRDWMKDFVITEDDHNPPQTLKRAEISPTTYISETDIHAALSKKGWSERDIYSVGRVTRWSRSLEEALRTAKEWRDDLRRLRARSIWGNDDLEIYDKARVTEEKDGGPGYWVQARVRVEDDDDE